MTSGKVKTSLRNLFATYYKSNNSSSLTTDIVFSTFIDLERFIFRKANKTCLFQTLLNCQTGKKTAFADREKSE